jgi:hypothetical protein
VSRSDAERIADILEAAAKLDGIVARGHEYFLRIRSHNLLASASLRLLARLLARFRQKSGICTQGLSGRILWGCVSD